MKWVFILILFVMGCEEIPPSCRDHNGCGAIKGYGPFEQKRHHYKSARKDFRTNNGEMFVSEISFSIVYCDEAIGEYRAICSNGGYRYEPGK